MITEGFSDYRRHQAERGYMRFGTHADQRLTDVCLKALQQVQDRLPALPIVVQHDDRTILVAGKGGAGLRDGVRARVSGRVIAASLTEKGFALLVRDYVSEGDVRESVWSLWPNGNDPETRQAAFSAEARITGLPVSDPSGLGAVRETEDAIP